MFLFSCGPNSLEEVRIEGESETRKLAQELRSIENKEDLQKALPRLRKRFNKLADILALAQNYSAEDTPPTLASEELFIELARIYEMPGGRVLVETAQAEAIKRLEG